MEVLNSQNRTTLTKKEALQAVCKLLNGMNLVDRAGKCRNSFSQPIHGLYLFKRMPLKQSLSCFTLSETVRNRCFPCIQFQLSLSSSYVGYLFLWDFLRAFLSHNSRATIQIVFLVIFIIVEIRSYYLFHYVMDP